ncbi:unnamed protein product [Phytophthora fragariaefolia]|uniref:Unnamed protein product n=1 Tax=Phytophthora fragariaefolia TaxID=1490495 RepID=A0A9W6XVV4_9STRA|nr:unnamed protein product [Phytophthora fragariaefolia]
MADAELSPRSPAAEEDAPGAENEYGLQDLARLPLLEQTNAWKTLPLEQKKKMLEYIRDKRQRKAQSDAETKNEAEEDEAKGEEKQPPVDPAAAVKTDLYLKMLQQRSLRSAGPVADAAALPKHPNSAYIAPAEVPHYAQVKPKFKPRWQVAEGEFFEEVCACGVKHDAAKKGKKASMLLHTISSMMSTFGDSTQSCVTAVEEVQALENELEDVEEEELAEELDLFAVSETEDVFNEAFLVRKRWSVALTFLPAQPLPKLIDQARPPAAKTRRVGVTAANSKSVRIEPKVRASSTTTTPTTAKATAGPIGKLESVGTGKPTVAASARPTRLKRLR